MIMRGWFVYSRQNNISKNRP